MNLFVDSERAQTKQSMDNSITNKAYGSDDGVWRGGDGVYEDRHV